MAGVRGDDDNVPANELLRRPDANKNPAVPKEPWRRNFLLEV
jgi:hypothetical protein